jgi:Domain of unknown function (DUF1906)
MASVFWGVDSVAAAHHPVPAVTGKVALYDYLVAKGLTPSFFGRYLDGGSVNLTTAEVGYLHGKGCAVLPVYRKGPVGGKNGAVDASRAIEIADALSMAAGVTIYTDVEPLEKPTVEYITTWCTRMWNSKYGGAGGFYCNNWVGSDFMRTFKKAFEQMDQEMRGNVRLWCQYPLRRCGQISSFEPDKPTFFPSGPTVWQYALGCLPYKQSTHSYALIDMNTANATGMSAMWKPASR